MNAEDSAAADLGPHLLGRIPSEPDDRDYKLADFLASDQSLRDQAVALLKRTTRGYVDSRYSAPPTRSSNWYKALALLAQIGPSPAPTPPPAPSGAVSWKDADPVLDQGQYGTCVGNGWSQWANTEPVNDNYTEGMGHDPTKGGPYARSVYYESTVIDGQPDNPDAPGGGQQGSQVRSGAKTMQNRKRLSAYAFAATVDDALTFLKTKGSVVCGTDWTSDMFDPDADGVIKPTGSVEGGHCYLMIGYDPATDLIEFLNSWGSSWGKGGRFYMHKADFEKLFSQQGELCAAVELAAA